MENSLAKALPVAIGFMANLAGLGGIVEKIKGVIKKLREPIDKAVEKVVGFVADKAKGLLGDDKKALAEGRAESSKKVEQIPQEIESIQETDKFIERHVSKRLQYLGKTPGKSSPTGQKVIERMTKDEKIKNARGNIQFMAGDGKWYPIEEADMAHKVDAVTWWNNTGRFFGPKSIEVRKWMLNPDNYYLEHYSINRSAGVKLEERYLDPK